MVTIKNVVETWIRFDELKVVKNEACTFIKMDGNREHSIILMVKLPIQAWDNAHEANFNCLNLGTGNLDFCNSGDFVLPVDIKMQLHLVTKTNGFREEPK